MPLILTDDFIDSVTGVSIRAVNSAGKRVVVITSREAIQDYGFSRVEQVASDKYDEGRIEPNGTVVVRTPDFISS